MLMKKKFNRTYIIYRYIKSNQPDYNIFVHYKEAPRANRVRVFLRNFAFVIYNGPRKKKKTVRSNAEKQKKKNVYFTQIITVIIL